eukprot:1219933-Pyramimonas_sp.AAC.1
MFRRRIHRRIGSTYEQVLEAKLAMLRQMEDEERRRKAEETEEARRRAEEEARKMMERERFNAEKKAAR